MLGRAGHNAGAMSMENQEEVKWGMAAHLAAFAGFTAIPGANVLGPLVVWWVKRDTMPFVADQGREALNFNITVLIIGIVALILSTFTVVGYLLLAVIAVGWLVLTLQACMDASKGIAHRYPFTLRLIR